MNLPVEFIGTVRYYGGAEIARVNGCTCSSTNSKRIAFEGAAWKAFKRAAGLAGWKSEEWILEVRHAGGNIWTAIFTEKGAAR